MLLICPPVGENFENSISEMAGNAFNFSTMVGENFENQMSELAGNLLPHPKCFQRMPEIQATVKLVHTKVMDILQQVPPHFWKNCLLPPLVDLPERQLPLQKGVWNHAQSTRQSTRQYQTVYQTFYYQTVYYKQVCQPVCQPAS